MSGKGIGKRLNESQRLEVIEFEGFNRLYQRLIFLKEQICLIEFESIGAADQFDGVAGDIDRLESRLRKLSALERQKRAHSQVQLTLHDFFRQ